MTNYSLISITENIKQSIESKVQYTIKSNTFQRNILYSTEDGVGIQLFNSINADIESNKLYQTMCSKKMDDKLNLLEQIPIELPQ